jgi:cytochrome P450
VSLSELYPRWVILRCEISSTLFGAHGTVALSMSWLLYEVVRRPDVQARMRQEILEMKAKVDARENTDWTPLDLDGSHYTDAVIRVC